MVNLYQQLLPNIKSISELVGISCISLIISLFICFKLVKSSYIHFHLFLDNVFISLISLIIIFKFFFSLTHIGSLSLLIANTLILAGIYAFLKFRGVAEFAYAGEVLISFYLLNVSVILAYYGVIKSISYIYFIPTLAAYLVSFLILFFRYKEYSIFSLLVLVYGIELFLEKGFENRHLDVISYISFLFCLCGIILFAYFTVFFGRTKYDKFLSKNTRKE